jgi:5-keto 4-deoxyuronate isomerase
MNSQRNFLGVDSSQTSADFAMAGEESQQDNLFYRENTNDSRNTSPVSSNKINDLVPINRGKSDESNTKSINSSTHSENNEPSQNLEAKLLVQASHETEKSISFRFLNNS